MFVDWKALWLVIIVFAINIRRKKIGWGFWASERELIWMDLAVPWILWLFAIPCALSLHRACAVPPFPVGVFHSPLSDSRRIAFVPSVVLRSVGWMAPSQLGTFQFAAQRAFCAAPPGQDSTQTVSGEGWLRILLSAKIEFVKRLITNTQNTVQTNNDNSHDIHAFQAAAFSLRGAAKQSVSSDRWLFAGCVDAYARRPHEWPGNSAPASNERHVFRVPFSRWHSSLPSFSHHKFSHIEPHWSLCRNCARSSVSIWASYHIFYFYLATKHRQFPVSVSVNLRLLARQRFAAGWKRFLCDSLSTILRRRPTQPRLSSFQVVHCWILYRNLDYF